MTVQLLVEGQGKIETVQTCTSQPFSRNNRASRSRAAVVADAVMADSWSSASCCEAVNSILMRRCLATVSDSAAVFEPLLVCEERKEQKECPADASKAEVRSITSCQILILTLGSSIAGAHCFVTMLPLFQQRLPPLKTQHQSTSDTQTSYAWKGHRRRLAPTAVPALLPIAAACYLSDRIP